MSYLYLEAPICNSSNFMCIQEAGLENITVIIFVSQGLVQQPVDEIIQTGESVTLTCLCNSFPSAEYSWERNLIDTDEFETIENESDEQFAIDLVDHEDFGIYQCVIHTSLVNTIINGRVPTFNVVIIGRLSWISNIIIIYFYLILHIIYVSQQSDLCTQMNQVLHVIYIVHHHDNYAVQMKHEIIYIQLHIGDPTINITKTGSITLGNMYNVSCQVMAGTFRPLVTWFYSNGSQVNETQLIKLYSLQLSSSTISIMSFDPLSLSHAGEYICNVNITVEGKLMINSSDSVTIIVQSKLFVIVVNDYSC